MNCLTVEHSKTHISVGKLKEDTHMIHLLIHILCNIIGILYTPALVVEAAYAMRASSGPPLSVYPPS